MEDSISIDLDLEENVFSCSSSSSSLHPNSENEGNISDVYSTNGQNEWDMSDVSSTNGENERDMNDVSSTNGENEGDMSDLSSTNGENGLLQDLDSSSDELQPLENETVPAPDDQNGNLSISVDNLANDICTPDEMFEILNNDPEWTQNFMPNHVKQFSGPVGHKLGENFDTSVATPLDYFQLFFDDTVFERLCMNTNKFKDFRCTQKRIVTPNYEEKFWNDMTVTEMRAYFGIAIILGLLNQYQYRTYWSKDPFLGNPGVQRVFSLKHYCKLSEYLHVSDQESEKPKGHAQYDKLGKIRWLYSHLLDKFPYYKYPEHNQCLDEMVFPYSGWISYLQFNVIIYIFLLFFFHSL